MPEQKRFTVLHISPSYKPAYCYGGPTFSVGRLCEALQEGFPDVNTLVFTTTADGKKELELESGCKHIIEGVPVFFFRRLTGDHTHFSPALLLALHRYLKKERLAQGRLIVHIHSWWNLVALLSAALVLLHRIPLIISPRGMITAYTLSFRHSVLKRIIHQALGKYILKQATVHATSDLESEHIRLHCPRGNITVIPNLLTTNTGEALQRERHPPHLGRIVADKAGSPTTNGALQLLFLSRIDKKKGLQVLFLALALVDFQWTLTVAGDGLPTYIRTLKQLSGNLKISSNIKWVGQVANHLKNQVLARHDLLVLPSRNENFGNVVLESLSVGTAVLVSENVGLAAYISRTGLGWVCAATPTEIAQQLSVIRRDERKLKSIRASGARQILADFDTNTITNHYLQLYRNVLTRRTYEVPLSKDKM